MSKRTPYEVRKEILNLLLKESILTYTKIQTKLSTNYDSVKNNLKELEEHGLVKTKTFEKHNENGRPYFEAERTPRGHELAKRYKEKTNLK